MAIFTAPNPSGRFRLTSTRWRNLGNVCSRTRYFTQPKTWGFSAPTPSAHIQLPRSTYAPIRGTWATSIAKDAASLSVCGIKIFHRNPVYENLSVGGTWVASVPEHVTSLSLRDGDFLPQPHPPISNSQGLPMHLREEPGQVYCVCGIKIFYPKPIRTYQNVKGGT